MFLRTLETCPCVPDRIVIGHFGFYGEGKTRVPGEKEEN